MQAIDWRFRRAGMRAGAGLGAALFALGSCSCHGAPQYIAISPVQHAALAPEAVTGAQAADTVVDARFHHVDFSMWPGVALRLDDLNAHLRSRRPDGVVSFDDPRSFVVDIDDGAAGLTTDDLSRLMNTYVFAYRGAPLRGLAFSIQGNHLVQRGILHKVVDIPFEMVSDVSVTAAGEIRVHPVSMKICSINGEGLMKALGITLSRLLDLRGAKGVRVEGNDLLLDPTHLLPPPAIAGHLVAVQLEAGMMVQRFAKAGLDRTDRVDPDSAVENYMMFRGGTLQFGKLFMVHSDMQVMQLTSGKRAFAFDIVHYHDQLVAGYHRTLPDDALLVFMPDADRLTTSVAQPVAERP